MDSIDCKTRLYKEQGIGVFLAPTVCERVPASRGPPILPLRRQRAQSLHQAALTLREASLHPELRQEGFL